MQARCVATYECLVLNHIHVYSGHVIARYGHERAVGELVHAHEALLVGHVQRAQQMHDGKREHHKRCEKTYEDAVRGAALEQAAHKAEPAFCELLCLLGGQGSVDPLSAEQLCHAHAQNRRERFEVVDAGHAVRSLPARDGLIGDEQLLGKLLLREPLLFSELGDKRSGSARIHG